MRTLPGGAGDAGHAARAALLAPVGALVARGPRRGPVPAALGGVCGMAV